MQNNLTPVNEMIDSMLGVIPESETEFIGALLNLTNTVQAALDSNVPYSGKIYQAHVNQLHDLCEEYIGEPSKPWHFQMAAALWKRPVAVVMDFHKRYLEEK